jgi:hypothetical protein
MDKEEYTEIRFQGRIITARKYLYFIHKEQRAIEEASARVDKEVRFKIFRDTIVSSRIRGWIEKAGESLGFYYTYIWTNLYTGKDKKIKRWICPAELECPCGRYRGCEILIDLKREASKL